jgi:hypothetical protein
MRVVHDRPVYKWYHYVGTHVPPHWDASCNLKRNLEAVPANYLAQARCILEGIAGFVDALKSAGIYDKTAVIVSGDHGHNTVPSDQLGLALNYGMYQPLLGTGRPALMIKAMGSEGELKYSTAPTDLLNIAPTARQLAGLSHDGSSVFDVPGKLDSPRLFLHYPVGPFWSGNPVTYVQYEVFQPSNNAEHWMITDIQHYGPVPGQFEPVNRKTSKGFLYGARLRSSLGQNKSSLIRGRQLAFIVDIPSAGNDLALEVDLQFEPWMSDQSVTIQLNGATLLQEKSISKIQPYETWITLSMPVSTALTRDGPDFVSILFENVYPTPGKGEEKAAARIRSIRVVEENKR